MGEKRSKMDLGNVYKVDVVLHGTNRIPGAKKVCIWQNKLESCKPEILLSQVNNCMQSFLTRDKETDVTYEMSFKIIKKADTSRRRKVEQKKNGE